jgi:hypothetical protein
MRLGVKMPWIPDDNLESDLPHQGKRLNKPIIPKQQIKTLHEDALPSLLPKINMKNTVSFRDEPDDDVVFRVGQTR